MLPRLMLASITFSILISGKLAIDTENQRHHFEQPLKSEGKYQYRSSHTITQIGPKPEAAVDRLVPSRSDHNSDHGQYKVPGGKESIWENSYAKCRESALYVKQSLAQKRLWAIQVLDAMGKPNSGLLMGNTRWLGNYPQCHRVKVLFPHVDDELVVTPFGTKYCTVVADIDVPLPVDKIVAIVGVCAPTSCRSKALQKVINEGNYILPNGTAAIKVKCEQTAQFIYWDYKQVGSVMILVLLCVLVLTGTLYDVIVHQSDRQATTATDGHVDYGSLQHFRNKSEEGFGKFLMAFSACKNGNKILSMRSTEPTLDITNGIRVLGMMWVTAVHVFIAAMMHSYDQVSAFSSIMSFGGQIFSNGHLAVDVFFTVSGFVVSYSALRTLEDRNGKMNWLNFYLHRYIRLTPTLIIVVLLVQSNFLDLVKGPTTTWAPRRIKSTKCTMWTNLLYINNIYKATESCYSTTWYLANDFQYFAITPLLLIPLYRSPGTGVRLLFSLLASTTFITGVVCFYFDFKPGFFWQLPEMMRMLGAVGMGNKATLLLYYAPYARIGPYLVGMYTGFLLYRNKCRSPPTTRWLFGGWLLTMLGSYYSLFGLYGNEAQGSPINPYAGVFYNAVSRTVFGASISWIIYVCATGKGGILARFLSWQFLRPLGRLCYMIYLVHFPIHSLLIRGNRYLAYFDYYFFGISLLGVLVVSTVVSFFASLIFEAPFIALESTLRIQFQQNKQTNVPKKTT